MARPCSVILTAALTMALVMGWAGLAQACDGAGVITRIEGRPQDVVITRTKSGVTSVVMRPRILEVICHDDIVRALGTTYVVLNIDGYGMVRVDHNIDYIVPARTGVPSIVGNAYRAIDEYVMPDMKRLPWNIRIKGAGGDDFGFALPDLTAGDQQVQTGSRVLLVRVVGGVAPYTIELRDAQGNIIGTQSSVTREVIVKGVTLKAGTYRIRISDATPVTLEADIKAVDAPPPVDATFADLTDQEVRSALTATELARGAPAVWSFEAEQQLQAAPTNGLDRNKVYELIESYSTN